MYDGTTQGGQAPPDLVTLIDELAAALRRAGLLDPSLSRDEIRQKYIVSLNAARAREAMKLVFSPAEPRLSRPVGGLRLVTVDGEHLDRSTLPRRRTGAPITRGRRTLA